MLGVIIVSNLNLSWVKLMLGWVVTIVRKINIKPDSLVKGSQVQKVIPVLLLFLFKMFPFYDKPFLSASY